ncbi:MAG: hypothetical protein JST81_13460 [Bacteroidetes bacterium]|nr:hypothetical protein [Bacteroidota bacterium]
MKIYFPVLVFILMMPADARTQVQPVAFTVNSNRFVIEKTRDGKDMIRIAVQQWDSIAAFTKYRSPGLSSAGKRFCVEIADKRNGMCRRGIGFGCSMYDCLDTPGNLYNRVDNNNRVCAVLVSRIGSTVQVIFLDKVDWGSLEESISTQSSPKNIEDD